jgi:hypothetical protein
MLSGKNYNYSFEIMNALEIVDKINHENVSKEIQKSKLANKI